MSRPGIAFHEHISTKTKLSNFDKLAYLASFLYPLSGIYQVVDVLKGNTSGVSIYSWVGFSVFAGLFLVYGLKHKIVPMIISNIIWLAVDGAVVLGILLNSN